MRSPLAFLLSTISCLACLHHVIGHARLWQPPGRSTMWRRGFNTPRNYDDNQLFCGGLEHQKSQGYKCGVCGDPYDKARQNEAGGKYATGILAENYTQGQQAIFQVDVTAHHKGYFEFRLCPVTDPKTELASQRCLDTNVLQVLGGEGTRYYLGSGQPRIFNVTVQLPHHLSCDFCVLQFRYHTGNSWGIADNGTSCLGCGPQEEFYACADIRIYSNSGSSSGFGNPGTASPTEQTTEWESISSTPPAGPNQGASGQGFSNKQEKSGSQGKSPTQTASQQGTGSSGNQEQPTTQSNSKQVTKDNQEQPTTQSKSDSNSKQVTCNQDSGVNGDQLVCRSKFQLKIFDLTLWCQHNCQAGYCPTAFCECKTEQYPHEGTRPKGCRAAGAFANTPGMDNWCLLNCPSCPSSHCVCPC